MPMPTNKNTLTDERATSLTMRHLSIDQDEVTMPKTYAARLQRCVARGKSGALPPNRKNKIPALIRYEMGGCPFRWFP